MVKSTLANPQLADSVLTGVKAVLGEFKTPISLHEPVFNGNELAYVENCIKSGWVSSVGTYVDLFEQKLAEYTGAQHAIAVVNGTAALHTALKLAGVKPGDEVILPALTFVATANAIVYCDAIPHFVDNEMTTLGLNVDKLSAYLKKITDQDGRGVRNRLTGRYITAIVPMHTFGHPIDLDALLKLTELFPIAIIEDAAEALGSYYKGAHVGTLGKLGTLSFNGNKIITTGGGGAILTNDPLLAKRAKHITTTAKIAHRWLFHHDEVGFNYRLPNLNAALGCAQLEQLDYFLAVKRQLANRYKDVFASIVEVEFIDEPVNTRSNFWLNTIRLKSDNRLLRDELLSHLNNAGYLCRPVWTCLADLPMYQHQPQSDLSTARYLENTLINLPSSVRLLSPNH
jgi:perosamine synthetase